MTDIDTARSPFTATAFDERRAVYTDLAADGPVHRVRLPHGEPAWLVTGYDEVRQALADPRLVKGGPPPVVPGQPLPADVHHAMMSDLLHLDPPDHTRLRRLVSSAFTRRRVEDLAPRIEAIADDLLDRMLTDPPAEVDLIPAYAFPLPMTVLCELLGVPTDDAPAFRDWSTTLVTGSLAPVDEWVDAATSLIGYVRDLLDRKRHRSDPDLLGALVAARDGSDRLSEDELTSMVFLLLIAGQETTVNLIANGVLTLLTHPAELAAVRAADPATALPAVVEEVLRHEGPVQVTTPRIAAAPLELGGTLIAPGDLVVASVLAAGRDPRRPGADVFAPRRSPALPHTAFGHGVHRCLGAPLARLEGRIALDRLLTRCPGLRLATAPDQLVLRPSLLMHGPTSLPVALCAPA
jgi:cytochrome P450